MPQYMGPINYRKLFVRFCRSIYGLMVNDIDKPFWRGVVRVFGLFMKAP